MCMCVCVRESYTVQLMQIKISDLQYTAQQLHSYIFI